VSISRAALRRAGLPQNPVVIVLAAVGLSVGQASAATGAAAIPYLWQNCMHVHTKDRHGVGKVSAHDRKAPRRSARRPALYSVRP
jgi:hypothetical protein